MPTAHRISDATRNRALYLAWLEQVAPDLYVESTNLPAQRRQGMGDFLDSLGSAFSNVVTSVSSALPSLAQTYAQYESAQSLIELNSQRAKQGLAPVQLVNGQLVPVTGLTPTSAQYSLASTGNSTLLWVGIGGLALLGVFLITRK